MKQNYWQRGEKKERRESDSDPLPPPPPSSPPKETSAPTKPQPAAAPKPDPVATEVKKPPVSKSKGGFNLNDLSDLVTSSVKHNSTIKTTELSRGGSVEVVLSQNLTNRAIPSSQNQGSRHERASPASRASREQWRPIKAESPPSTSKGSWREGASATGGEAEGSTSTVNTAEIQKVLKETKGMSTGESLQYALERMGRTTSESSSKSVEKKEKEGGDGNHGDGDEAWYDEEDDDQIDYFQLTM